MNSYPHEFLAHPQPLMFVAGLSQGAAAGPSSSANTTRDRSSSVLSASSVKTSSRRPSHSALDPNFAAGSVGLSLTSPLTSPGPSQSQLPQSPPADELAEDLILPELDERDREFDKLLSDLRGALATLGERSKVWIPEDQRKGFRIVLVDKGVRLPLRKIAPPAGSPDNVPHSPLSPITPSSPVHPDGLIAPVWVRKHAELVPSVFVLFLRLYEPPLPPDTETAEEKLERESRDKAKEKEMDDALVREIGDRRKRLGERGIKLTVVLMASAATLDSPSLDPRLSYLRRASQLSAKASLFVLTPVPADQLPDFVQSLQDALYDAAMEYYGSHAKRVRRKRARLPTGQFATQYAPTDKGRPLGAQGWGVRYDWKAGWFAELRGEFDAARRHYEDCWNELAKMFSSTQVLPPRTKRWAEAKVLADCVAIRICRLLLYSDESARVTGPFFVHMKRYGDLSRGWGIGEETFEFWSWIARQYRIFAELLEMAQDAGVQLPPLPLPVFPIAGPATGPPTPEHWSTPVSSTNPIHALQQPAFYYYTAATCAAQRKKRYEEALELEEEQAGSEAGGYISTAPGFANEKKVDHAGLVVELFSKAYSLLKDQEYSRNHAALYVAYKIAETYCQAGQHEMAMKFFERISPTFKKDKWSPIVRQIRSLWYECAQVTGSVETAARLLMEMMCPHSGVEGEERAALQEDLALLLRTTAPSSTDPVVIEMEHESLLDVQAGFWSGTAMISSEAPFQLVLAAPPGVDVSELAFDEVHVAYSDGRAETVLKANGQSVTADSAYVSLDKENAEAPLKWGPNGRLVLSGTVSSDVEEDVQISSVKLVLSQGTWNIHLVFFPEQLKTWHTSKGSLVPTAGLSESVSFEPQPQAIKLDVQHLPSAYVGETFPISVKVSSEDDRDIEVQLAVFLQPGGEDNDASTIRVDDQESKSLLNGISLGKVAAGASVERVVHLKPLSAGPRVIDLSLSTTTPKGSTEEMTRTVTIPVVPPFVCVSTVVYRNAGTKGGEATVRTLLKANGPSDLLVDSLALKTQDDGEQHLLATSLDPSGVPKHWTPGTKFAIHGQYRLGPSRRPSLSEVPPPPGHLVCAWRTESAETTTETTIPLPALILPISESFISASLTAPPLVDLHHPFCLPLEIVNSHPTHSALVSVERATADAFVWTGDRAGQLEVAPGEAATLEMQAVAVGVTGWGVLPKVTVWEGRSEAERREVKIRQDTRGVYVRP